MSEPFDPNKHQHVVIQLVRPEGFAPLMPIGFEMIPVEGDGMAIRELSLDEIHMLLARSLDLWFATQVQQAQAQEQKPNILLAKGGSFKT